MNTTSPRKGNLVVYLSTPSQPRLARVVRSGHHDLTLRTFDQACPLVRVSPSTIVEVVDEALTYDCDCCGQPCRTEEVEGCYAYWGISPDPYGVVTAEVSDCCQADVTRRRETVQP